MRNEAKANEEADKKAREQAEKINMVNSLLFQTEKQLKEVGEKIPADKKAAIKSALTELKSAKESNNIEAMDAASEKLNAAWQAARKTSTTPHKAHNQAQVNQQPITPQAKL